MCTFPAHPKCLALVDTPCPGAKTSHAKKTLDQAKASLPAEEAPATATTTSRGKERPAAEAEEVVVPDVDVDEEETPKPKARAPPRPFTTQSSVLRIDADKEELVEGATSINDVYTIGEELGRYVTMAESTSTTPAIARERASARVRLMNELRAT